MSVTTFESRWGHHPVSYLDFLLLRHLHRLYWKYLYEAYRWQRVERKLSFEGPNPNQLHPAFFEDKNSVFYTDGKDGSTRGHYLWFTPILGHQVINQYWHPPKVNIVRDFNLARTPKSSPFEVEGVDMGFYHDFYLKIVKFDEALKSPHHDKIMEHIEFLKNNPKGSGIYV